MSASSTEASPESLGPLPAAKGDTLDGSFGDRVIQLRLKPGREASVERRHPWLFSGAVAQARGDGEDGQAEVLSAEGRPIARGAYSPDSQIVARLWTFDGRVPDAALFRERFASAKLLRRLVLPPRDDGLPRDPFRGGPVPRRDPGRLRRHRGLGAHDRGHAALARRARICRPGGLRAGSFDCPEDRFLTRRRCPLRNQG